MIIKDRDPEKATWEVNQAISHLKQAVFGPEWQYMSERDRDVVRKECTEMANVLCELSHETAERKVA